MPIFLLVIGLPAVASPQDQSRDLSALNLQELADIETTTSTRTPTELSKVPAAIYVITREDIRRSGVTSIPEALRLAPGVQVARIDSNKWAIGLRGFSSRLSRAMLVMIDGRAVYTPLFAGTYWEVQDTFIEDIDRIEVVLGPGGTLWGANAVNGIVNIITKSSTDTRGLLLAAETGSLEPAAMRIRYGGKAGTTGSYRTYGKFFDRNSLFHTDGSNFDDWRMGQAGFRADWTLPSARTITLQGDVYRGTTGQRTSLTTYAPPFIQPLQQDANLSGGNMLGRWGGPVGGSDVRLQIFYDRTTRKEPTFKEARDTIDLDFQQRLPPQAVHQFLWGAGYRVSSGNFDGAATVRFVPNRRTDQLLTWFVQDDIEAVRDHLHLILGSKFEHNGYSGFEVQPSARLLWTASTRQTLATSMTRAVRTPSRVEHDLDLTSLLSPAPLSFARFAPSKDFDAEQMLAYEVEYRVQPTTRLSFSWAGFFNDYQNLLSIEPETPFMEGLPAPDHIVVPFRFGNGLRGNSYGFELTSMADLADWWRLTAAYSRVTIDLTPKSSSRDVSTERSTEGSTPGHQVILRSSMNLPARLQLDWMFRAVSQLRSQNVSGYATSDIRVGWDITRQLTVALVGQNLHEPHHAEFASGGTVAEARRGASGRLTWQW